MSVTLFGGVVFDFGALCSAIVMVVLWAIIMAIAEGI